MAPKSAAVCPHIYSAFGWENVSLIAAGGGDAGAAREPLTPAAERERRCFSSSLTAAGPSSGDVSAGYGCQLPPLVSPSSSTKVARPGCCVATIRSRASADGRVKLSNPPVCARNAVTNKKYRRKFFFCASPQQSDVVKQRRGH